MVEKEILRKNLKANRKKPFDSLKSKIKSGLELRDYITFFLVIVFGAFQIILSRKMNQITLRENGNQFKPNLEQVNYPIYLVKNTRIENRNLRFIDPIFDWSQYAYPILDLYLLTTVEKKYTLTNTGSTTAKIIFMISKDTLVDKPILREIITHKTHLKYDAEEFESFFQNEMLPQDTIVFKDEMPVDMDDTSEKLINHFLIVYVNEDGTLFDTYIITRFKLNQPLLVVEFANPQGDLKISVKKSIGRTFFKYDTSFRTHHCYSIKEKRRIMKYCYTKANLGVIKSDTK